MDDYLKSLPELENETDYQTAQKILSWWEVNGHGAISQSLATGKKPPHHKNDSQGGEEQEILLKRLLE